MPVENRRATCSACVTSPDLGFDFTMAFQPIVDLPASRVFAHEALVRGVNGEGAGHVISQVDESNRYRFDQLCRVRAIELAARLDPTCCVSINFMPNAVYDPARCIRTTLTAAEANAFPIEQIIFEFTEDEQVRDPEHLKRILAHYQQCGFRTAIDDFGAGFSGLNLLADVQPDIIKLDMALVRGIHDSAPRQAIVRGVASICADLGIDVVAEGIETGEELEALVYLGIRFGQGFYLARPSFETLTVPACTSAVTVVDG